MDIDLNEDHSQQEVVRKSPRSQHKIERKTEKRSIKSGLRSVMKASSSASSDKTITCKLIPNFNQLLFTSYHNMPEYNLLRVFCCFRLSSDQKLHRAAFLKLDDNTEFYYKNYGETLVTGRKQGDRILCDCCSIKVSPSQFEAHAGMGSRKKPYGNIYLSSGVSLHEYASTLQLLNEQTDIEQIACTICRAYDFEQNENVFNDRTVIVCDQCEKEYHIGCLWEKGIAQLQELPPGKWFCCSDCWRLHRVLIACVAYGPEQIPGYIKYIHRKKLQNSDTDSIAAFDVKWVVIRGNDASEAQRLLLAEAFDIFHDCFDPIIDSVTGNDLIPSMTYGSKMGDLDFFGVHCAMLMINSKLVTAGLFRVLGHEIVEFSIVATSRPYQKKGYFQIFFSCFERSLGYLKIQKMVVPAAEASKGMWIDKFGFKEVTPQQLFEYKQSRSMVRFVGTTLLEREVPKVGYTYEKDGY